MALVSPAQCSTKKVPNLVPAPAVLLHLLQHSKHLITGHTSDANLFPFRGAVMALVDDHWVCCRTIERMPKGRDFGWSCPWWQGSTESKIPGKWHMAGGTEKERGGERKQMMQKGERKKERNQQTNNQRPHNSSHSPLRLKGNVTQWNHDTCWESLLLKSCIATLGL